MDTADDLPLALRRPRRTSGVAAGPAVAEKHTAPSTATTPSRRRRSHSGTTTTTTMTPRTNKRKRVRFSDPGPQQQSPMEDQPASATGLTPSLRRTTLGWSPASPASPSSPSRRHAPLSDSGRPRPLTFLPLRHQILDGRVQRRLRRNGLSEEMNTVLREKRQRATALAALRAAVAAKDEEIAGLRAARTEDRDPDADDTILMDTDRVLALEREVAALRQRLAWREEDRDDRDDTPANWTLAARDPFAYGDEEMDLEADAFHEASLAELQCSTPQRTHSKTVDVAAASFASSFPTPPATSPIAMDGLCTPTTPGPPDTPDTPTLAAAAVRRLLTPSPAVMADAAVQTPPGEDDVASAAETRRLRDALAALQQETAAMTAELAAYAAWAGQLDEQLPGGPASTPSSASSAQSPAMQRDALTQRVTTVLRALADKTAVLADLSAQVCALVGGNEPGTASPDASPDHASPFAALDRLAAAGRAARLALEHLAPGESTLPLVVPAGPLLGRLAAALGALGAQTRAADAQIDEYHALERSLRQQLGDRVAAMDGLAAEAAAATAEAADAAVAVDRMKGALASYARDVAELEALVGTVEGRATRAEKRLAETTTAATAALALRDARVLELRAEIDRVNVALRAAHDAAQPLRVDNAGLRAALDAETARTAACRSAVAALQAELVDVAGRLGKVVETEADVSAPAPAPAPAPRRVFSLGSRRRSSRTTPATQDGDTEVSTPTTPTTPAPRSSKKRRRYDSGLGFLDEEVVDA